MRIDDLAQALVMSVHALQQEGQPWSTLGDAARRDAPELRLRNGASLDEAAWLMRHHDASSLSRAARRWFGKTAGEWRRLVG